MIDGRRIWLASGQIDYFRVPRAQWAQRIRDAAEAGLNTVTVRCPWALHEPRKGDFHFDEDLDIPHFLDLIAKEGMMCILRPGPYVGSDLDLGGMPSWLRGVEGMQLRQSNPAFLDATSKYLRKLLDTVGPYNGSKGGPIVLVQVEHEWYCGNPDASDTYLLEIARFIRERDFDLPMVNTNNLWQHREETIDSWSGYEQMLMHLRQLRTIHRNTPLIVGDFKVGTADTWGEAHHNALDPKSVLFHMGQVVAAGAQYTITPFAGGTNFGFTSSRVAGTLDKFLTTSMDQGAMITETGERTETYYLARRLNMFTSNFSKVFSALDVEPASAVLAVEPIPLEDVGQSSSKAGPSVVHLRGSQGDVVFLFGNEKKIGKEVNLLLPDGTSVPVAFGGQSLVWCLLETHIGGRAVLNWTNLNAFATNNRSILVLYGSPGQTGYVCINRSRIELTVPKGATPLVEVHEDVTLVVCSSNNIDFTYLRDHVVHVGIAGFDDEQNPVVAPGLKRRYEIREGGEVKSINSEAPKRTKPSVSLDDWKVAPIDAYIDGTAPRYAVIDGPSTQEECNAGSGYGFMRFSFEKGSGKKHKLLAPGAGDRIHFYSKGSMQSIIGTGFGAEDSVFELKIPSGKTEIVALIDNLGRYGGGNDMDEGKGIVNHIHEVAPLKLNKPEVVQGQPLRPFAIRSFLEGMHANIATSGVDCVYNIMYRKKSPLIMEILGAETPAIITVNDTPVAFYAGATGRPSMYLILDEEPFRRGKNEIRIATIGQAAPDSDVIKSLKFYESKSIVTESAEWAFAKWEQPKAVAFKTKTAAQLKALADRPLWMRSFFTVKGDTSNFTIWLETNGLSKGQAFINGHNLGRFFVSTHENKSVGPQKRLRIPASWLKAGDDQRNEVAIFDEHGRSPEKVKIVIADSAV